MKPEKRLLNQNTPLVSFYFIQNYEECLNSGSVFVAVTDIKCKL